MGDAAPVATAAGDATTRKVREERRNTPIRRIPCMACSLPSGTAARSQRWSLFLRKADRLPRIRRPVLTASTSRTHRAASAAACEADDDYGIRHASSTRAVVGAELRLLRVNHG